MYMDIIQKHAVILKKFKGAEKAKKELQEENALLKRNNERLTEENNKLKAVIAEVSEKINEI
jgi:cell division protein FtsB